MADLLIALGGTGQHVALAASRLVFLGALAPMTLRTIDAEDTTDLAMSLQTFGNTVVKGQSEHPLGKDVSILSPFVTHKEKPLFVNLFIDNPGTENRLFELCYEERLATTDVKEGFFGRPSVGAAIFMQNRKGLLKPVFDSATNADRIFIAGSMVGGTGAGIIHQLVKSLRDDDRIKAKDIFGLVFLNWLSLSGTGSVDSYTLGRNMRFGLKYFDEHTRPQLNASVVVGLPSGYSGTDKHLTPATPGQGDNSEQPHYFHLLAAYGIRRLPDIKTKQDNPGTVFAAKFDPVKPLGIYEESWGDRENPHPLSWYVNRAMFVKAVLSYAASPKFEKEFRDSFGLLGKKDNVGCGLYEAVERWERSDRKSKIPEIVQCWKKVVSQYEFSLQWLDRIVGALPEAARLPVTTKVLADEQKSIKTIQTVWKQEMPRSDLKPTPLEIAQNFHHKLVNSFSDQKIIESL